MQYYKYTERKCRHILPMVAVYNYPDQVDIAIAWWKWGVYINLYTK